VHSEYKTVPNQFSDYIANPKKNGYRSIHTAVVWRGKPLEVQLRTWEMHYECETGLAAHWQYKQYAKDRFFDKRLSWAKQLVEWHRTTAKDGNFVHSLKMGFGRNKIFVFTPKQQVVVLPEASTPIDFAFAIHSDLGRKCLKAKVNDKIAPLSYKLDNAETVEIIPSKQVQTKRQWLTFAKSQKAQTKIKQSLGIKLPKKKKLPERKHGTLTSDKNSRIAKCCNPVPGDEILGVRTTKRKISVHRAECGNVNRIPKNKKLEIKWGLAEKDYVVGIRVKARGSPSLLPSILKIISASKVAITSTDAKTSSSNILHSKFNVKIKNIGQLDEIINRISALPAVFEAGRD
jgi:(p)ppGpp synthase/HD superfamily hydrolase